MEIKLDPHNYEKAFNLVIRNIEKSKVFDEDKTIIFRFKEHCTRQGLSKPRIIKTLGNLKNITLFFNETLDQNLDQVNKKSVEAYITKLEEREDYSPWTKKDYKVILKKFFKWFKDTEDYPEEVKWVETHINRSKLRMPTQEGLITENDIKILINKSDHPRDKAFAAVLYESGCRIGELLCIKLNNVSFDEYGALINVYGKTGSRKIRLIASTPYLVAWMESHPFKDDKESPLWVNYGQRRNRECMVYPAAKKLLKIMFKKAGINKRYNPHIFRHSRATYLANHLTEFQMNQYFGWIQGSNMPAVYVHLSGRETDSALLALSGFKIKKEDKESTLSPIKCPRCDNINSYDAKFCGKCAGILDIQTAMKLEEKHRKESEMRKSSDELMNKLMNDSEVYKLIMEKIATMGLNK